MSQISNLSLRIYGGSLSGGLNRQPLVSVGTAPEGFVPMPPTLVDEQQSWMITHAQSYTAYMSYSKRCLAQDEQPGQLLICLFFNPQQRLADGNSPLGLLDSLNDSFAVQAMRGGKLPSSPVDNSPFKMLLERYRLEPRPMLLPIMSGHEPVSSCMENRAQLDALMRHSRYPVLASVGRLELGMHCKSTVALTSTSTPKKKEADSQSGAVTLPKTEPEKPEADLSGGFGLDLDETPYVPKSNPWYKKLLRIAAICIGSIIGLFIVLFIYFMITGTPDNQSYGEDDEIAEVVCDSIDADNQNEASNVLKDQIQPDSIDAGAPDVTVPEVEENSLTEESRIRAEEEETKKMREAEMQQRAAEASKMAEEEKKKKEDSQWIESIRSKAQSCPIQLRFGVHISSISWTSNSVTITVNYDELSKYNLSESDRSSIASDRSDIISKYGSGLPAGVSVNVVQKDRAGRNL